MNVTVNDLSQTRKELIILVPAETTAREEEELVTEFAKQASIPGFRPGKAPAHLIRARFKKGLQEELDRKMAQKTYEEAVKQVGLEVFNVISFEAPEGFKATAETRTQLQVDIVPTFELPALDGIATNPPSTEVTDEEIEKTITTIRRQRADFNKVDRPAAVGDYVQISYKGTVDGQPLADLLPQDNQRLRNLSGVENSWEEAGTDEAKQFGVPAIVDGIVGMSAGEEKSVDYTLPDTFPVAALQGKLVTYQVTVHEVRERVLPPMDEAFFKNVQADGLEDLKAQILDQLEAQKKQQARAAQRQQVIEYLEGQVDFPLPESALEQETQQIMGRVMVENIQRGVPEEEFEKNKETFYAQSRQHAQREVKRQLLLTRIAREKEIKVTDEDLQRAIIALAQQRRTTPEELSKELRKDRNRVLQLQRQILFSKTLDYLVSQAKVG